MSEENEREKQPQNEQEPKQDSVEKFLAHSMREGKERTPESLICAKLWRAGSADKLTRVISLVEASWNAQDLWSKKFKPDTELLDVFYSVASSLKETKPEKASLDGYHYFMNCRVPWNFTKNAGNFDKYVKPWLKNIPEYHTQAVFDPERSRVYTTRFLCPYCSEELLAYKHSGSESKTIADFMNDYKGAKIEKNEHTLSDFFDTHPGLRHGNWDGPYREPSKLVTHYFECPKCKNFVILKNEREEGAAEENFAVVAKLEKYQEQFKWIKREVTNEMPKDVYIQYFWNVTHALSQCGFQSLKNMFISWANPQVSKLEMEIGQHISKNVWDQYFKEQREGEDDQV